MRGTEINCFIAFGDPYYEKIVVHVAFGQSSNDVMSLQGCEKSQHDIRVCNIGMQKRNTHNIS